MLQPVNNSDRLVATFPWRQPSQQPWMAFIKWVIRPTYTRMHPLVSFISSFLQIKKKEHTFPSSWDGAWRCHQIFHPSSTRFFYACSNDNLYLHPAGFTVFWLTGGKALGLRLKSHANTLGTSRTFCSHGHRWLPSALRCAYKHYRCSSVI